MLGKYQGQNSDMGEGVSKTAKKFPTSFLDGPYQPKFCFMEKAKHATYMHWLWTWLQLTHWELRFRSITWLNLNRVCFYVVHLFNLGTVHNWFSHLFTCFWPPKYQSWNTLFVTSKYIGQLVKTQWSKVQNICPRLWREIRNIRKSSSVIRI